VGVANGVAAGNAVADPNAIVPSYRVADFIKVDKRKKTSFPPEVLHALHLALRRWIRQHGFDVQLSQADIREAVAPVWEKMINCPVEARNDWCTRTYNGDSVARWRSYARCFDEFNRGLIPLDRAKPLSTAQLEGIVARALLEPGEYGATAQELDFVSKAWKMWCDSRSRSYVDDKLRTLYGKSGDEPKRRGRKRRYGDGDQDNEDNENVGNNHQHVGELAGIAGAVVGTAVGAVPAS